jgi:hypothetical protein
MSNTTPLHEGAAAAGSRAAPAAARAEPAHPSGPRLDRPAHRVGHTGRDRAHGRAAAPLEQRALRRVEARGRAHAALRRRARRRGAARRAGARAGAIHAVLAEARAQEARAQACGAGRYHPFALRALLGASAAGLTVRGVAERAAALGLEIRGAGWIPADERPRGEFQRMSGLVGAAPISAPRSRGVAAIFALRCFPGVVEQDPPAAAANADAAVKAEAPAPAPAPAAPLPRAPDVDPAAAAAKIEALHDRLGAATKRRHADEAASKAEAAAAGAALARLADAAEAQRRRRAKRAADAKALAAKKGEAARARARPPTRPRRRLKTLKP